MLGRGQPGLMRWIMFWIMPLVQDWSLNLLISSPPRYTVLWMTNPRTPLPSHPPTYPPPPKNTHTHTHTHTQLHTWIHWLSEHDTVITIYKHSITPKPDIIKGKSKKWWTKETYQEVHRNNVWSKYAINLQYIHGKYHTECICVKLHLHKPDIIRENYCKVSPTIPW